MCIRDRYIDLRKGFDSLCHLALIKALKDVFKINSKLLLLIVNYLSNRTYFIKLGQYLSKGFPVNRGIGQGFVLGPTLFILYVNEIGTKLKECLYSIFADDIALYISGKNVGELLAKMKIILNELDYW